MRVLLPVCVVMLSVFWYIAPRGDHPRDQMSPALRAYFESPIEVPMPADAP